MAPASPPPIPIAPARPAPLATVPRLPFGAFLGLRFLKPRRTFVSIITVISVLGVVLGVGLPIIVLSVMTGFDRELHNKVLGFDAHIEVTRQGGLLDDWRQVRKAIAAVQPTGNEPRVTATAPYVRGPVLVEANNQRAPAVMRGIDPDMEREGVTDLDALIKHGPGSHAQGKFDLDGDKVVIGYALADLLKVQVGDKLIIISTRGLNKLGDALEDLKGKSADEKKIDELRSLVAPEELTVSGIFDSGRYPFDAQYLFVPFHIGQEIYELNGAAHGIAVKTTDPNRAELVKNQLLAKLDPSLNVKTWIDLNSDLFDAVRTERTTMFVILFFILIVAAFCVMNTLITVTVQKTREIGIMKAVGADVWQIVRVFLTQGVVVGLFGTLGGLVFALGILRLLNPFKAWMEWQFGVVVFSKTVYGFGQIPYFTSPDEVTIICVSAFVICSLAALIPAYFAARLDPVKALRFE